VLVFVVVVAVTLVALVASLLLSSLGALFTLTPWDLDCLLLLLPFHPVAVWAVRPWFPRLRLSALEDFWTIKR